MHLINILITYHNCDLDLNVILTQLKKNFNIDFYVLSKFQQTRKVLLRLKKRANLYSHKKALIKYEGKEYFGFISKVPDVIKTANELMKSENALTNVKNILKLKKPKTFKNTYSIQDALLLYHEKGYKSVLKKMTYLLEVGQLGVDDFQEIIQIIKMLDTEK